MCVRSEGASPIYTRTSSSPSLAEIDSSHDQSHDLSSGSTEGTDAPLEMTTPQKNHLSGSTSESDRNPHCTGYPREPPAHIRKETSTDSGDSSETESCLLKDRTSAKFVSLPREGGGTGVSSQRGVEGGGCDEEEEVVEFCVGDVRKRLSQHSMAPKKTYQRDPEDPSG